MMFVYHDMIIKNINELSYLLLACRTEEQRDELIDFLLREFGYRKVSMIMNMAFMLLPDSEKKNRVRQHFGFTIPNTEDIFASVA